MEKCRLCSSKSRYTIDNCIVNKSFAILSSKWVLPIILELSNNDSKLRFNELQRKLFPITPKILATRLKEMEAEKIIGKDDEGKYYLLEKGKDARKLILGISEWGAKWSEKKESCITISRLRRAENVSNN
jgi:DNA-binding HxlR family transcriptional regulator